MPPEPTETGGSSALWGDSQKGEDLGRPGSRSQGWTRISVRLGLCPDVAGKAGTPCGGLQASALVELRDLLAGRPAPTLPSHRISVGDRGLHSEVLGHEPSWPPKETLRRLSHKAFLLLSSRAAGRVKERPKALTFLICRVVHGHRGDPRTCSGQRNKKGVVSFVESKREPSLCYQVLTGGSGAPSSAEESAAMDDGRGRALGVTGTSS